MRDIALTALVALLLLATFKHPVLGAYAWAWLSLMTPHKLTFGFAFTLPFAQAAAVMCVVGLMLAKKRQRLPLDGVVTVLLALLAWMTVTCFFAIADSERVLDRWIFVMKIQVMLFITWKLVTDEKQLRVLIWVIVLSVAYFGIKGGVWTVLTGGGGRVWGPPGGLISGNNELAVALVMLVPFLYWLRQTTTQRWIRWALTFALVSCAFSILGSQSRGALLALVSMALFLALKSKRRVGAVLTIGTLVVGSIAFMPDSWTARMETMGTYEADSSAMSRIYTWKTLWNTAVDRPLVGAGFAADNSAVFARYSPKDGEFAAFDGAVYVAHSIYFQMLGEHGFVGLGLFLLLGIATWRCAGRVGRRALEVAEYQDWMPTLMNMVQVSLIGYAVGGAFLSIAYLDLPYYIIGFVVTCDALLREQERRAARSERHHARADITSRLVPAHVQAPSHKEAQ